MTIEHMRDFGIDAGLQPRAAAPTAIRALAGVLEWMKALASRRAARRMLKRVARRPEHLYLDEMPPYLLRDLGLPPDFR